MDVKELKKKYDRIINDVDFDKLELGLKNPNIFQILRISKTEIRHSNFLSWLLDPNESHKLGDIFLKRFLREVFSSDKFDDVDQVDVEGMDLSSVEILREWKNIDILINLPDVVVCVENKVLSKEHSNQLSRYKKIIESSFPNKTQTFVYLNPDGENSDSETDVYHPVSYEFIIETLQRIISVYGNSMNNQVTLYIKDYITIIKRELMKTDELTELSNKIYKNHKDLFDFIYENRPEPTDNIKDVLMELIKERGWWISNDTKNYIWFLTPKMKEFIYLNEKTRNGWVSRESFLFEILISKRTNKLVTKTVISPSDDNYDTFRLNEMLMEINGFKSPIGKKWLCNYTKPEKFDFEELSELTTDELTQKMNKFLDKFEKIVNKVEDKFLEHSEELIEMKNNKTSVLRSK